MDRAFQEALKVDPLKSDTTEPPIKKQRTSADFFSFCNFILEYENYEAIKQEMERQSCRQLTNGGCIDGTSKSFPELRQKSGSPLGSTAESFMSDSNCSSNGSTSGQDAKTTDESEDDEEPDAESWDLITCYCMKPFAGRPMIECSQCLTWVHLSCAKIRRNNIPEEFTCQMCKDSKNPSRRSRRGRESGGDTDEI